MNKIVAIFLTLLLLISGVTQPIPAFLNNFLSKDFLWLNKSTLWPWAKIAVPYVFAFGLGYMWNYGKMRRAQNKMLDAQKSEGELLNWVQYTLGVSTRKNERTNLDSVTCSPKFTVHLFKENAVTVHYDEKTNSSALLVNPAKFPANVTSKWVFDTYDQMRSFYIRNTIICNHYSPEPRDRYM